MWNPFGAREACSKNPPAPPAPESLTAPAAPQPYSNDILTYPYSRDSLPQAQPVSKTTAVPIHPYKPIPPFLSLDTLTAASIPGFPRETMDKLYEAVLVGGFIGFGYGLLRRYNRNKKVFIAEMAHRAPRNMAEVYFFNKSKHYHAVIRSCKAGFRDAAVFGLGCGSFILTEELLHLAKKRFDKEIEKRGGWGNSHWEAAVSFGVNGSPSTPKETESEWTLDQKRWQTCLLTGLIYGAGISRYLALPLRSTFLTTALSAAAGGYYGQATTNFAVLAREEERNRLGRLQKLLESDEAEGQNYIPTSWQGYFYNIMK